MYIFNSALSVQAGWPLTWEFREISRKNLFDEKVREIHENLSKSGKSQGKLKLFCKYLVVTTSFISIFCQRIRVINAKFCYIADKSGGGRGGGGGRGTF